MIDARPALPVTASDRVSDVLARDESLIDVFVQQAPHFTKLRNRAMRKVMARLLTVEQAARTANVSPDHLVSELNAALGIGVGSPVPVSPTPPRLDDDSPAVHPASANVIEIDVREDLRSGREPFSRIMNAVSALAANDVLHLRAIFEPAPLFTVLGKRGFAHESKAHAPDDWSVWFWRPQAGDTIAVEASAAATFDAEVPPDDPTTTYLDVRAFSPPEPMMRTLIALETLPSGHTLVQINARVPQFLFPVLAERGFAWDVDESRIDRVLVRIRHAR
jgi:uncharacterized protein (DUF2249 family)